jgi:AhpD family alkylhydroperoxidase
MKDGALSVKEKEFIALGISVTQRCAPCIRVHIQKCLAAGATKEQILEAACVAVLMGGSPAYTHIPIVINTIEELE